MDDRPDVTDEQLAAAAKAGCLEAFEQLCRRYQVRLLPFLGWQADAQEAAEDLVQETLLQAFRTLHTYRDQWQFSTWIFTIARNLASRRRVRRRIPIEREVAADDARDEQEPWALCHRTERRRNLWSDVRRHTSDDEFTALWMFYAEDLSVTDIANVIDRSVAATKMMISRTRRRLATCLQSHWDHPLEPCGHPNEPNAQPLHRAG